jgi:hypothetical protein
MTNASIFSLPFQVQGRSCHTVSAMNREFPAITVSPYRPTISAAFFIEAEALPTLRVSTANPQKSRAEASGAQIAG